MLVNDKIVCYNADMENLNIDNFKSKTSEGVCVVDFWAGWCGPCRMLSPIVDEIAKEQNDVKVCKINVDENQDLAAMFQVMSIPTLVLIKDGKIVNKSIGYKPKQAILQMLNA